MRGIPHDIAYERLYGEDRTAVGARHPGVIVARAGSFFDKEIRLTRVIVGACRQFRGIHCIERIKIGLREIKRDRSIAI